MSAVNREEALAKAKELGKPNGSMTVTLEVDESSLQPDPDRKLTSEWDRKTASMFY